MTPILMTPSLYCACARPGPDAEGSRAASTFTLHRMTVSFPFTHRDRFELLPVRLERGVRDHVDHPAVLDHVVAVGHRRGEAEVLFHEQDGEALLAQHADGIADLLHDDRRQALGRLVEQQQLGAGAQDAGDGQHLLLAARQLGALAGRALLQVGKQLVDLVQRQPAALDLRRQHQVLPHVEAGEDAALLGAIGDALPRDAVGLEPDELAPVERDRALALGQHAHDRAHGGGLAGAVAAEQRHHLAGVHVEASCRAGRGSRRTSRAGRGRRAAPQPWPVPM